MRLDETVERLSLVAEIAGEVVGTMLVASRRAKVRDQMLLCLQATDACVLPAYRESGVMSAIRQSRHGKSARRYAFSLSGQTGHPAMIKTRRLRPEQRELFGNRLVRFVRSLDREDTVAELGARRGRSVRWLGHDWTLRTLPAFDERMNVFFHEAAQAFEFIIVRDLEYLAWRFNDRRAGTFSICSAEQDGAVLGYAVLALDARRQKAYLADLLVLPGRLDVAHSLVHEALDRLRRERAGRVECWLPGRHPYGAVLSECGFLPKSLKWRLGFRIMAAPEDALSFAIPRRRSTSLSATRMPYSVRRPECHVTGSGFGWETPAD